ncbi:MAG: efflux RND transporter permease subunit [Bacilli bacterium]
MNKLLRLKRLFISISIGLIILGINSFINIPKQENPDLGSLYTQITIEAVGKNNEELDRDVIETINSQVSGIDGIGDVFSYAYDNFGLMIIVYDIEVENVNEVESKLNNAIAGLTFDENVDIEVSPYPGVSDLLYVFPRDDLDKAEQFQSDLYSLDSVKNVKISDYSLSNYQVNLDNNMLATYGIDSSIITQLLSSKGIDATLGIIEGNPVITTNGFDDIEELNSTVIGVNNNTIITLDMVSEIVLNENKDYVNTYNGEDSLFLSVQFDQEIDVTKVGDEVKDIAENYPSFKAVSFSPDYVDDAINEINSTLLVGMVLVLIVSMFSLGIRSALTILITFPLTIFTTILFLDLINVPLQNVSIAGLIISIGIIVDNAIVIVDAIIHELESGNNMDKSISDAIKTNALPIFTSTLTTVVAFTPLLFLPGIAGKMASSLPITVIAALICSFLSSIFVIPVFGSKLLKPRNRNEFKFVDKLIRFSLRFPKVNVLIVLVLLVVSIGGVYIFQPIQLFPTAEKDYIYVDFELSSSNRLEEVEEIKNIIEENIDSENVISSINYSIPAFYSTLVANSKTPNTGRVLYINEGSNSEEIERIKNVLNNKLPDDVTFNVEEIMMNAPGAPIQIILYDIDKTENLIKKLENIDGVESIQSSTLEYSEKYSIDTNDEILMQFGINEAQVYNEIARLINDTDVNVLNIDSVSDEIVVSNNIDSMDELLNQIITVNEQTFILSDLVKIETVETPVSISRTDFKVANTIDVFVDSNYTVYNVNDAVEEILDKENANYIIKGEKELTTTVFTNVIYAGIAALLLILMILLAQFNSFKKVIIILTSILFSLIGSALFILIFDQPITFTATLGLVSLMGIVVNNGILLVDYINKSPEESVYDKCFTAVKRRSRPIITSNITTIIGLIPLIIVGSDFFRPMAITLVGGLIIAIPLSLCVIPSLYLILNKNVKKDK